ncbi:MAG: hypothetical protein H6Q37_2638, partial [Chloroflexi bacterium]|nr:hypothetical protein [Chloroflexota bacterium]
LSRLLPLNIDALRNVPGLLYPLLRSASKEVKISILAPVAALTAIIATVITPAVTAAAVAAGGFSSASR